MFPTIVDTKPLRRAIDDSLNWVVTQWGGALEAAAHPLLLLLNAIQAALIATPWWLIVALLTAPLTDQRGVYVTAGVVSSLVTIALLVGVLPYRQIARMRHDWKPIFPSDP